MAKGARMSVLPIAQRCGRAAELSVISSTENALAGTAWHASNLQPGSDEARAALAKLTDEERAEVESWKRPTDIETPHGMWRYADCEKELELGLDASGEACDPSSPDCVTVGHMDMGLVLEHPEHGRCAYVVDAKRSEWTTADGPETLQLHAYGLAYASLRGCDAYITGVWACLEGRWWWSERMVDMWSREAQRLRERVVHAALNQGGSHVVGSHCRGCYGRWHCPGWLIPPELALTSPALRPLTGEWEKTDQNMLELLITVQRMEDTAEKAKKALKEWALKRGIPDPKTGKRWAAVQMPGRESLDQKALAADGVDITKYMRKGNDYVQMKWLNDKGARS